MGKKNVKIKSEQKNDYDLGPSLKKIDQNKESRSIATSPFGDTVESNNQLSSSASIINQNEKTPTSYQLHDTVMSKFDKVNDDINCVTEKIHNENKDLRKELETKIDKKLNTQIFVWACIVICLIGSIIYALSYNGLDKKVESNSNDLRDQKNQILNNTSSVEKIESKIEAIKQKQEQTDKSLYELNFKTKK